MFNTLNLASISVFSIHVCTWFYTITKIVPKIFQTMFQKYLKHVLFVKKWSRIINNWYYFYLQVRREDGIWWSIQIVEWTSLKKLRGKVATYDGASSIQLESVRASLEPVYIGAQNLNLWNLFEAKLGLFRK